MADITIGGSTAAAAAGLDPYKSRVRLWAELTGRLEHEEPGEWAEAETRLESAVRGWTRDRENVVIVSATEIAELAPQMSNEFPSEFRDGFLLGHPDGYVAYSGKPLAIYEGKTTGFWRRSEWDEDGVPIPYVVQAHVYMHLTGLPRTLLGCLVGGQSLKTVWIDFDSEIWTALYAALGEFIGYCERDEPPPPDGSESTSEALKALYPQADPERVIVATADDYQAAVALAKVKAQRSPGSSQPRSAATRSYSSASPNQRSAR